MLCTVSDASFCILDIETHVFFRSNKQLPVFRVLISSLLWKIWRWGAFDARTYGMQSERSTICATSPLMKRWAYDIWSLSSVNAIVGRSSFVYRSKNGFVDAGHQFQVFLTCQSLALSIDMPRWWGPKELFISYAGLWFSYQYSNVSFDVFLRYALAVCGTNRFLSKLCTVSDASFCIFDVRINVFFWSNKLASCC